MAYPLYSYFKEKTVESGNQITLFGIVMMINFPLLGLLGHLGNPISNQEIILRLIATSLCTILSLHKFWLVQYQKFLPFVWYLTLAFCLPFFFTYLTLLNHGATFWLMNCISATFFLFLVASAFDSLVLLSLGSGLAFFGYLCGSNNLIHYIPGNLSFFDLVMTFATAIVIGTLFARERELIHAKVSGVRLLAGSLVHDLRTPLASIYLQTQLQEGEIEKIRNPEVKKRLNDGVHIIERGIESINQLISIQLSNIQCDKFDTRKFVIYPITELLKQALEEYPFKKGQHELIQLDLACDYSVWVAGMVFRNLLWNILKNGFELIEEVGKGEISIWLTEGSSDDDFNYLHIRDTAKGISPEKTKIIFEPFYSERKGGTGIGLACSKRLVEAAGGSIYCQGELGKYTHFVIKFPKID